MADLSRELIDGLEQLYRGNIAAAKANVKVYLTNPMGIGEHPDICLLYTSPSPRDGLLSRMPSSA